MHKIGIKWKIKYLVPVVMSSLLVSCSPVVTESMVEGTVTEGLLAGGGMVQESQTGEVIMEESDSITVETTSEENGVSTETERPQEEVSEEMYVALTETTETYPQRVGLDYVEKPKKRTRAEAIEKIEELSLECPQLSYVVENEALYPDVLLTSVAENPEMADYMCGYPDSDGSVTGGFTEAELKQEYPLFLQFDPRWGYYPYGTTVMAHSGCGPTCLSMAIFYLTGDESITPDAVGKYSMDNGYYVKNVGTAWALLDDYPIIHGLDSEMISVNEEAMNEKLEEGNILICSMRPGDFTSGGHFVVVYGVDEEGYKVNDPKCVYRSNQSWSYKELKKNIKGIWCIGEW